MNSRFQSLIFLLCACISLGLFAQSDNPSPYPDVNENALLQTKWKYTYAIHAESNTIIHRAENNYDYFLFLKYDFSYEQFLNGKMTRGNWSINGSELFYPFKQINKFLVAEVTDNNLILEFTQPNSKGAFQYHFIRVDSKDAPFVKPANELPDVDVALNIDGSTSAENADQRKSRRERRKERRKNRKKKKQSDSPALEETKLSYLNIELTGGGYYGGIDPVMRDYIQIKSSGRLIKEFKSLNQGLKVTKKDISRNDLDEFVAFLESKGFFQLERMYDCDSEVCFKRKREKPTPVPLRIVVAYGNKKKVVTIAIWGKDSHNHQYVEYPPVLDEAITYIQRLAQ